MTRTFVRAALVGSLALVSAVGCTLEPTTPAATAAPTAKTGATAAAGGTVATGDLVAPPGIPRLAGPSKFLPSGLGYIEGTEGTGVVAQSGQTVTVHYTGWLTDGKQFDTSRDKSQPFTFQLGRGAVIRGWDEGVAGMKVGGTRRLFVPASLGYGAQGFPPVIPPGALLVFDVELLSVR